MDRGTPARCDAPEIGGFWTAQRRPVVAGAAACLGRVVENIVFPIQHRPGGRKARAAAESRLRREVFAAGFMSEDCSVRILGRSIHRRAAFPQTGLPAARMNDRLCFRQAAHGIVAFWTFIGDVGVDHVLIAASRYAKTKVTEESGGPGGGRSGPESDQRNESNVFRHSRFPVARRFRPYRRIPMPRQRAAMRFQTVRP